MREQSCLSHRHPSSPIPSPSVPKRDSSQDKSQAPPRCPLHIFHKSLTDPSPHLGPQPALRSSCPPQSKGGCRFCLLPARPRHRGLKGRRTQLRAQRSKPWVTTSCAPFPQRSHPKGVREITRQPSVRPSLKTKLGDASASPSKKKRNVN